MKTKLLLLLLTAMLLFFACETDEGSPTSSNRRTDSGETLNGDGTFDGPWRLVGEKGIGSNDFKFNEKPDMNFLDVDSGSELYDDTSMLFVLRKDTIRGYMYEPEMNPDTFYIEEELIQDYNELKPDEYTEEGELVATEENLMSSLKSRFMLDSVVDIIDYKIHILDDMTLISDTLNITFGFRLTADFKVLKNEEPLTGSYEGIMSMTYLAVSMEGNFPPDHWPKDSLMVTDGD